MAKKQSRIDRWNEAVSAAQAALAAIDAAFSDLETALDDLRGVREEYEEWHDGLPENLAQSAVGEKLQAIVDLDITDDPRAETYDDLESMLSEAEGMDMPLGFGRD
jgi:hypothetical protein